MTAPRHDCHHLQRRDQGVSPARRSGHVHARSTASAFDDRAGRDGRRARQDRLRQVHHVQPDRRPDRADRGTVERQRARPVRATSTHLRGKIGIVFQNDRLMPWRTAIDNVVLGLEILDSRRPQAARAIARAGSRSSASPATRTTIRMRSPAACASASRSRAPSRAIASILLCDEPFSSLDEMTAQRLRAEFLRLVRENGKTAVFITHSINEALEVGDRVMVLHRPARVAFEAKVGGTVDAGTPGRNCAPAFSMFSAARQVAGSSGRTASAVAWMNVPTICVVGRVPRDWLRRLRPRSRRSAQSLACRIIADRQGARQGEAGGNTRWSARPTCAWRRPIASRPASCTTCWRRGLRRATKPTSRASPRMRRRRSPGSRRTASRSPADLLPGERAAAHPAGRRRCRRSSRADARRPRRLASRSATAARRRAIGRRRPRHRRRGAHRTAR